MFNLSMFLLNMYVLYGCCVPVHLLPEDPGPENVPSWKGSSINDSHWCRGGRNFIVWSYSPGSTWSGDQLSSMEAYQSEQSGVVRWAVGRGEVGASSQKWALRIHLSEDVFICVSSYCILPHLLVSSPSQMNHCLFFEARTCSLDLYSCSALANMSSRTHHHCHITFLNLNTQVCVRQQWWSSRDSDDYHPQRVLLSYISPQFVQVERWVNIWDGYLIIHLKRRWAICPESFIM